MGGGIQDRMGLAAGTPIACILVRRNGHESLRSGQLLLSARSGRDYPLLVVIVAGEVMTLILIPEANFLMMSS